MLIRSAAMFLSTGTPPHLNYRADIDGLRAIAVLSVVGFHAFPGLIPGGFTGVDVFFVISGYLISRIIFESLANGTFKLSDFYARRVRRIFPALLVVLIVTYLFGSLVLLADEFKQLGKHVAGGAAFLSNIVLRNEAGYFDGAAESKPLLHLWSLGIEEQFYLVWPVMLLVAWKAKANLFWMAAVVAVISLCLNLAGVRHDLVAAFYSPQTRFWELLAGALLAWASLKGVLGESPSRAISSSASVLGALLLLVGFFSINKQMAFPGAWAILPVAGAVLVISAGPHAWLNRAVLSNRVLVLFGLISFPLYLWHWPLLTFLKLVGFEQPSRLARLAAVLLSIALAWLTYAFVERPIRFGKHGGRKAAALAALMVAVGYIGYITYQGGGLNFRTKEKDAFALHFENNFPDWRYFTEQNLTKEWRSECSFFNRQQYMATGKLEGGTANSKPVSSLSVDCYQRDPRYQNAVMIWGDSHAQVLSSGVVKNIPKSWQVLQVASAGCAPNLRAKAPSTISQCDQSNYFALETIETAKPDVVVVAQANGHSVAAMTEITQRLTALGVKKVLFTGPSPIWLQPLPKIVVRHLWDAPSPYSSKGLNQDFLRANEQLKREFKESEAAQFVDVIGVFCNGAGCLTRLGDDRLATTTSWDQEHLTPYASDYLAKQVLIRKIVGQ